MVTSTHPISSFGSTPIPAFRSQCPNNPAKSLSDDVLMRIQNGDPDAFTQLYLLHKRRVFAVCLGMVRDFSLAEDLTQETFLQVHRQLASFRGESLFTTWLHRMTRNIVLMRLRKHVLPVVSLNQLMSDLPDRDAEHDFDPRDRAQASVVDRIAIGRAVNALSPGYRKFFLLHDVHGLEHHEIASMQGCSVGNSKSQLHRARRILRRALSA